MRSKFLDGRREMADVKPLVEGGRPKFKAEMEASERKTSEVAQPSA
jgi:hypothetical protein